MRFSAVVLPFIILAAAGFGLVTTTVPALSQVFGVPVICGPFEGCQRILEAPASRVAGVPIALLGTLLFLTVLVLLHRGGRSATVRRALITVGIAGSVASVALQVAAYRSLGLVCPWCVGAAAALAVLAGLTWIQHRRTNQRPIPFLAWVITVVLAALFIGSEWMMMLAQQRA